MSRSTIERFEAKFTPEPNSGCWLWTAHVDTHGYGGFRVNTVAHGTHKWAYEHYVGKIPDGLVIDHLCRVRCCVNPTHMELVTRGENVLRGVSPSAKAARQTHCIHGHAFDKENTRIVKTPTGQGRQCRTCNNQRRRAKTAQAVADKDR